MVFVHRNETAEVVAAKLEGIEAPEAEAEPSRPAEVVDLVAGFEHHLAVAVMAPRAIQEYGVRVMWWPWSCYFSFFLTTTGGSGSGYVSNHSGS